MNSNTIDIEHQIASLRQVCQWQARKICGLDNELTSCINERGSYILQIQHPDISVEYEHKIKMNVERLTRQINQKRVDFETEDSRYQKNRELLQRLTARQIMSQYN